MNSRALVRAGLFDLLEDRVMPALAIQVDYSFDSSGFFASSSRRDLLEQAANSLASRLNDSLTAIVPGGINSWTAQFPNPATGATSSISNLVVPANTLIVYVGGRELGGSTLARGGFGGWSASGSSPWFNTIEGRGQSGAIANPATDFATWGGSIAFDSVGTNWFFGTSAGGLTSGQSDFYSVAVHELGHLLGIGTADSWFRYVSGTSFSGPNSVARFGGVVSLQSGGGHWAEGTTDAGREAALDPTLTTGTRKTYTELDYAGLRDVGWQVGTDSRPLANAGGAYSVQEGGQLTLDASQSFDPENDPLSFSWDINGDGVFGDATGATPTLSWSQLGALGIDHQHLSSTVKVRVDDGFGGIAVSAGTSLSVNAAPDAALVARPTGLPGEARLTLYAVDANAADQAAGFQFLIDWNGDGTADQSVQGLSGVEVTHSFASASKILMIARDQHQLDSQVTSLVIDPAVAAVVWAGTGGSDQVTFTQTAANTIQTQISVLAGISVNQTVTATGVTKLVAAGGAGNDTLDASGLTTLAVDLRGGAGNDTLLGGAAADVLMGDEPGLAKTQLGADNVHGNGGDDTIFGDADGGEGAPDFLYGDDGNDLVQADGSEGSAASGDLVQGGTGDDILIADGGEGGSDQLDGGAGRDLLVAGLAHDTLHGGAGEDILLTGQLSLATAAIQPFMRAIESEWTSGRDEATRIANITGVGSGPRNNGDNFLVASGTQRNVLDDSTVDDAFGDAETDWFLANLAQDLATDLQAGETVTTLTS